jgi:hypothetical protein
MWRRGVIVDALLVLQGQARTVARALDSAA